MNGKGYDNQAEIRLPIKPIFVSRDTSLFFLPIEVISRRLDYRNTIPILHLVSNSDFSSKN